MTVKQLNNKKEARELIKQTIRLYLLFAMGRHLAFGFNMAMYVIFLQSHGLNLFEVNMVNFVFFTTLFLFEIPTGAIADVFGRKTSYVLSCFIEAIGFLVYAFSTSFLGFAIAEALIAIGATLASGAFQAWMVDRLKHFNYKESLGNIFSLEQRILPIVGILSALVGGYCADVNMMIPWLLSAGAGAVMGFVSLVWMKEEYRVPRKVSISEGTIEGWHTSLRAITFARKSPVVSYIFLVGLIQMFCLSAPNMFWQPLFIQLTGSRSQLSWVWVGMSLFLAIGSWASNWLRFKFKDHFRLLVFVQAMIGITLMITALLAGNLGLALGMFLINEIFRGMFRPAKDTYLNENIPSTERATIISVESIAHHIGGAVGLFLSGVWANSYSIEFSWLLSGIVLVIGSMILFFIYRYSIHRSTPSV